MVKYLGRFLKSFEKNNLHINNNTLAVHDSVWTDYELLFKLSNWFEGFVIDSFMLYLGQESFPSSKRDELHSSYIQADHLIKSRRSYDW